MPTRHGHLTWAELRRHIDGMSEVDRRTRAALVEGQPVWRVVRLKDRHPYVDTMVGVAAD
ncbi:hypothetical protein LCGC14_3131350 [marine sediment metagenome]|uniref:Uncharacterized protein n=1 Tax=marine sediment metagenome TaxID=412755 RepID=A0A0F8YNX9_9ZZZZ